MEKDEAILKKFGICPSKKDYDEIKQLLIDDVQKHEDSGCGEYLRVLCFMIFYYGHVEDCELIWKAKNLNMDTACCIDIGLTCGAGYTETINYLSSKPDLIAMKSYIEFCNNCGDQFNRDAIIDDFKYYYWF